jgi:CHAT domain-containing protein
VSVFGAYGSGGGRDLPRVLHVSVRPDAARDGSSRFACSLHEEGTGISWQYPVELSAVAEERLIDGARTLAAWASGRGSTASEARRAVDAVGRQLYRSFLGRRGEEYLRRMRPTAVLVDVDETILSLPWELMHGMDGPLVTDVPVGRLVATRTVPHAERDPLVQDREVRILAVADPTVDLALAEAELDALRVVVDRGAAGFTLKLDALTGKQATVARFRKRIAENDYDILHFAGHAGFAPTRPGLSALRFADGVIRADAVLSLPWPSPPGIVFASACESAMASRGARLVGRRRNANGLAAAFLSAGVAGYLGYLWPVSDDGAGLVAGTFYDALFTRENVGLAVLEARRAAASQLTDPLDLAGYSLVLYGDAASEHRRDLAMAH